ncbi:MAG TPA: 4-alpha-glucanotransferase [Terriglobales bacterium]|nr:4-alpha-glucanotransferase [Terriglobales bacterium]
MALSESQPCNSACTCSIHLSRSSGILLHPTSLHGRYGVGELGPEAFEFIDFLQAAGQKLWQVLPLNPTGYGDSPYQCFSAFAGNPLLISLDRLAEIGVLDRAELRYAPKFCDCEVEFGRVIPHKRDQLLSAARTFFRDSSPQQRAELDAFREAQRRWLPDFALFMAAKEAHGGVAWTEWDPALRARKPKALADWRERLAAQIADHEYWQFEFFRQWRSIQTRCAERGIHIMGDAPIYVAHDSADVWANQNSFWLDEAGRPLTVAGVPPDYFSATGQLWGNPIYRWDLMRESGYQWWIDRLRAIFGLFEIIRLDHFRGFEAYWEVPAGEPTAVNGKWVEGPGRELFIALRNALGNLPVVAENLGVITPEVEALRKEFGFPGMAIAQFAFSKDEQAPSFRPHNYVRNLVAYTGGHDNDTMIGWWRSGVEDSTRTEAELRKEKTDTAAYFGVTKEQLDREVNWLFIRAVYASVARIVLVPMQDVLGLGSEARMNVPGTMGRNWKWRMKPGSLTSELAERLREFTRIYER